MAASGGFKPSNLPPITETGIRGFLKWYQREQPHDYRTRVAPAIMAGVPQVFSDYTQSVTQRIRARAGEVSLARRVGGLGDDTGATNIVPLTESDLTPVNVAADDTTLSLPVITNIDASDAANTGQGTPTATTDWIGALVNGATSLLKTNAQINTAQAITSAQLTRAQQGLSPLNIGLNANGIPTITGALGGSAGTLLMLAAAGLAAYFIFGRKRAAA